MSRYAWHDFNADMKAAAIAFDALPRALNPPKGYVASANNRPTPIGFAKPGQYNTAIDHSSFSLSLILTH